MLRLAAAAALIASPAATQTLCMGYADAMATLDQFGEVQAFVGPLPDGQGAAVIYVNPDTGSWTFLVIQPDGTACLVTGGVDAAWNAPPPNV